MVASANLSVQRLGLHRVGLTLRNPACYPPLGIGPAARLEVPMTTDVLTPTLLQKHCALCGQDRPRAAFYKRSRSSDGLQRHCRDCSRSSLDAAEARRQQPQPLASNYAE